MTIDEIDSKLQFFVVCELFVSCGRALTVFYCNLFIFEKKHIETISCKCINQKSE